MMSSFVKYRFQYRDLEDMSKYSRPTNHHWNWYKKSWKQVNYGYALYTNTPSYELIVKKRKNKTNMQNEVTIIFG
jgi:hypothetical protein